MKFEDALKLLREGKSIRRKAWDEHQHIESKGFEEDIRTVLSIVSILEDDWEEYIETHDFAWALEQLRADKSVKLVDSHRTFKLMNGAICEPWGSKWERAYIDGQMIMSEKWTLA